MKTYVLIISEKFPKTHKRSGDNTDFIDKIKKGIKKHTLRGNYELWKKRFEQINAGKAYLSIRVWVGKPYKSKQAEIFKFYKEDGIGVQKFSLGVPFSEVGRRPILRDKINTVANNDGLSYDDFKEWFKNYKEGTEMAIIHFTKFRY